MRKLTLALLLFVAGCSGVPMLPGLKPYQITIEQGNYLSQDMLNQLRPGMTRSQVRYVLGTPLITDPFHANQWDYVFTLSKGGKVLEYRRVVVIFDHDKLARVEGDVVPEKSKGTGTSTPQGAAPSGRHSAQEVTK